MRTPELFRTAALDSLSLSEKRGGSILIRVSKKITSRAKEPIAIRKTFQ
jgi:hypothetical protein